MSFPAWDRTVLTGSPFGGKGLQRGDAGWESYRGDAIYDGNPDLVLRPESEKEIAEILLRSSDLGIPVTLAGGQSGLTGAGAADEGILLATGKMNRLLDVGRDRETGRRVAVAEPGILLGDLQRDLEGRGWFYPPDPTSRDEACLGGTVATNATGEDTLLYGPTRNWIRELRVVTAAGEIQTLRRPAGSRPREEKANAGYYTWGDPIDLLIGSEGTLAAVTRITIDILERPPELVTGLAFFSSLDAALRFVVEARKSNHVHPRALELMDRGSLDLVEGNPEGIRWPSCTQAAVLFKEEVPETGDEGAVLQAWFDLAAHIEGSEELAEATLTFPGSGERRRLRAFRHRIPALLHDRARPLREAGGGKVGTDWWVPFAQLPGMFREWKPRLDALGIDHVIFGHVGNGHPHVNFMPENDAEKKRALQVVRSLCIEAVSRGGGVAGEHGLGKVKRDLLPIQVGDAARLQHMIDIKRQWDPGWVLGRGNLFLPGES